MVWTNPTMMGRTKRMISTTSALARPMLRCNLARSASVSGRAGQSRSNYTFYAPDGGVIGRAESVLGSPMFGAHAPALYLRRD